MRVIVVSADPAFFTVAHGISGAMGYHAVQAGDATGAAPEDLLVIDAAHLPAGTPRGADPMRTVVFVGDPAGEAPVGALGATYVRRDLAAELPRIIADFAL